MLRSKLLVTILGLIYGSTLCYGTLTISGMLQQDWSHFDCKSRKDRIHENDFTVQVDLIFDYKTDRSWTEVLLEFENNAGIQDVKRKSCYKNHNILFGSGTGCDFYLCKAFTGYSLFDTERYQLDFEIGRHYLSDLFESKIEFSNQFDGALLRYKTKNRKKNGLKTTVGAFVIDDTVNHFGYAGQIGLYNLAGSPFDLKYSLIYWDRKSKNRAGQHHALGNRFINSQILAGYQLSKKTIAYAAFLHNHIAKKIRRSNHTKAARGWYAGVTFGKVAKKNDWSFDVNYQYVQAQSIPDWDVAGIGAFDPNSSSFYSHNFGGFANYKGYVATLLYAITDQLSVQFLFQKAKPANNHIGRGFKAQTFEITAVYSF